VYAGQDGDPVALADAIAGLLDDPAGRADLGKKLRTRVAEHFSWERAGRQLSNIYRDVLERKA
jgi:glycosyltransferase involved in cell wall biosynthesis